MPELLPKVTNPFYINNLLGDLVWPARSETVAARLAEIGAEEPEEPLKGARSSPESPEAVLYR